MWIRLLVIFLILAIGAFYSQGTNAHINSNKNRKKYIIVISIILILQSGLRHVAVGADTYAYLLAFERVKELSWGEVLDGFFNVYKLGIGKDPGYTLLEKVAQIFISEYQVFLVLIAILFFSALGHFIYKNTTRQIDAIIAFVIYSVLFYGFFSITGHRQTIATAGALYGFELIKKKKLIPFTLLIICAATIHKSVLIFSPFYFIAPIKNTKFLNRSILVLLPFLFISRNSIMTFFATSGGYDNYEIYEGTGTFTFTVMFLLIAVSALMRMKVILKDKPEALYFYNAFALALLFIPLTWVNPNAMRIVQYFSIFMMLLVPDIINSFARLSIEFKKGITAFVIIVLIGLMIKSTNMDVVSYKFFWQKMSLGENYM